MCVTVVLPPDAAALALVETVAPDVDELVVESAPLAVAVTVVDGVDVETVVVTLVLYKMAILGVVGL